MAEDLRFEKRGQTFLVFYRDLTRWPILLTARHVYYGTGRLLATLTLSMVVPGEKEPLIVLTSHVDLLIASRRKEFAKLSTERLKPQMEASEIAVHHAIETMLDTMLERLLVRQHSLTVLSFSEIELPDDLTPVYVIWPFVPAARPGMLVAPAGTGKSSIALMCAVSVATGHVFHPRIQPRVQGPVLYVGQEEEPRQWATRLKMMCAGHGIEVPDHVFYVRLNGSSMLDSADYVAELAATKKAVLVIIDSAQATWGEEGEGSIRGYATRWFNTVSELGVPVWVIDHPNLVNTMKGNVMNAAGAGVKRDRVGHQWGMKSLLIPGRPGQPIQYHGTLVDVKRNYVAAQEQILIKTIISGHRWMRFEEADDLNQDSSVVQLGSVLDTEIVSLMQQTPDRDEGWSVREIQLGVKRKDDHRVRACLTATFWRPVPDKPAEQYRFEQVPGTGESRELVARYWLIIRTKPMSGDQPAFAFDTAPGDPEEIS